MRPPAHYRLMDYSITGRAAATHMLLRTQKPLEVTCNSTEHQTGKQLSQNAFQKRKLRGKGKQPV